jgi:hypothetical protein
MPAAIMAMVYGEKRLGHVGECFAMRGWNRVSQTGLVSFVKFVTWWQPFGRTVMLEIFSFKCSTMGAIAGMLMNWLTHSSFEEPPTFVLEALELEAEASEATEVAEEVDAMLALRWRLGGGRGRTSSESSMTMGKAGFAKVKSGIVMFES